MKKKDLINEGIENLRKKGSRIAVEGYHMLPAIFLDDLLLA
ncbi:MAG: hypothetical protein KatS3mg092_0252 [Patescibacteria group bacterium]|nr:MAG: hypothetical protein KatS3mg092_0252 [Patescibacteria group bacterium]